MNPTRTEVTRTGGVLIYVLVLVSIQIFLLVVAVEGVLAHDAGLARAAAVLSIVIFGLALGLQWLFRHG